MNIITKLILTAQKAFASKKISLGCVVAHPNIEKSMELRNVQDSGMAIIGFEDEEHTVPLSELFDPNYLLKICLEASANS